MYVYLMKRRKFRTNTGKGTRKWHPMPQIHQMQRTYKRCAFVCSTSCHTLHALHDERWTLYCIKMCVQNWQWLNPEKSLNRCATSNATRMHNEIEIMPRQQNICQYNFWSFHLLLMSKILAILFFACCHFLCALFTAPIVVSLSPVCSLSIDKFSQKKNHFERNLPP